MQAAAIVNRVSDVVFETFDQRGPISGLVNQSVVSLEDSLARVDLETKRYAFGAPPCRVWQRSYLTPLSAQVLYGHCQVHHIRGRPAHRRRGASRLPVFVRVGAQRGEPLLPRQPCPQGQGQIQGPTLPPLHQAPLHSPEQGACFALQSVLLPRASAGQPAFGPISSHGGDALRSP